MWLLQMGQCGYTAEDKVAIKRLRRKMAAVLLVFVGVSSMQMSLIHRQGGVLAAVVGVLSGLSFAAVLMLGWAVALRVGDEYRRALLSRSLAWGVAVMVAFAAVWGYLELDGVALPRLPLLMLPVVLALATAVAKVIVFRRERVANRATAV